MSLILDGSTGVSDVDGSAATPAIRGTDANTGIFFPAADTIAFSEGGVESMRIDSSGNVGIGTSSPVGKLQIDANTVSTVSNALTVNNNAGGSASGVAINFYNSSFTQPFAARINTLDDGAFGQSLVFSNKATGSSGAALTERMRITSTGNVGIGITNPTNKLEVVNSNTTSTYVRMANSFGSGIIGIGGANQLEIAGTSTNPILFYTSATERMRIDSSGNVGIGNSNPSAKLQVAGSILGNNITASVGSFFTNRSAGGGVTSGGNIQFQLDGTTYFSLTQPEVGALAFNYGTTPERMRIDSSGNLLVGTTSPVAKMTIAIANSGNAISTQNASGTAAYNAALFYNNGTSSLAGYINVSGSSTSYVTSSDYRLKENVAPMQNALATVQQLKPVTYNWKADGSSGQGFIAHELQAVVPDCVTGEKDAVDEEGKPKYQGIDTSFLVATLTAAIQEQQAMIEELKAKVAALEAA